MAQIPFYISIPLKTGIRMGATMNTTTRKPSNLPQTPLQPIERQVAAEAVVVVAVAANSKRRRLFSVNLVKSVQIMVARIMLCTGLTRVLRRRSTTKFGIRSRMGPHLYMDGVRQIRLRTCMLAAQILEYELSHAICPLVPHYQVTRFWLLTSAES